MGEVCLDVKKSKKGVKNSYIMKFNSRNIEKKRSKKERMLTYIRPQVEREWPIFFDILTKGKMQNVQQWLKSHMAAR